MYICICMYVYVYVYVYLCVYVLFESGLALGKLSELHK